MPYVWQPHEWVDGLTALDFSGPEIMVQGVVLDTAEVVAPAC